MRLATVFLFLACFVSVTIADDEKKQAPKDLGGLSSEKYMEKAIADYRKLLVIAYTRVEWDDIRTQEAKAKAPEQKRLEIVSMHKWLGIEKDPVAYEKAKATRMMVASELEKNSRKNRALDLAGMQRIPFDVSLHVELLEATLVESLNSILPPFKRVKK